MSADYDDYLDRIILAVTPIDGALAALADNELPHLTRQVDQLSAFDAATDGEPSGEDVDDLLAHLASAALHLRAARRITQRAVVEAHRWKSADSAGGA